jgi:RNA polymerase sigma factor (sigma-70 family)
MNPAGIPPFQSFLEEHRAVVYRFLRASVGPADADDAFQETFLAALRSYPRLRDASNLRGWVLTIATRKAIDVARSRSRRPLLVPDVTAIGNGLADPPGEEPLELRDPLWHAVLELPARQRAAVVHRHVLDRSYADVAAAMGSSEEAARANVSQGVRKLREVLSDASE